MNEVYQPLKIISIFLIFYLTYGLYIFLGTILSLVIVYFITEYYVSKLVNQYRDLMDIEAKIRFDSMSKDDQIRSLAGNKGAYNSDIIYIRDTIRAIYVRLV